MNQTLGIMTPISRRALALASGRLALLGVGSLSVEAKKKKKKKKSIKPFSLEAPVMTGDKEAGPNPNNGDPLGQGRANFDVKAQKGSNCQICGTFEFSTMTANSAISGVHIHKGAPGVDGPIVIDFQGSTSSCVTIEKSLANELRANPGAFYANTHTNAFPDGAVRDQLNLKA